MSTVLDGLDDPFTIDSDIDTAYIMRTPPDFTFSPQLTTPFDIPHSDWFAPSSTSPVVRAQSYTPFRRMGSSPVASVLARINQPSSPSAAPIANQRYPPFLLSPLKLSSPASSSAKENFLHDFDLFASPFLAQSNLPQRRTRLPSIVPQLTAAKLPLSPLSPLTPSPTLAHNSKKRRLSASSSDAPAMCTKRARTLHVERSPEIATSSGAAPNIRTFPSGFVRSSDFPLLYRRFPVSSYFMATNSDSPLDLFGMAHPGGDYRAPRSAWDLYSARFVKGRGVDKVGLCPICVESVERGGEDKKVWLSMKRSAFNYHMQCYHGIGASSGKPLSPPTDFRCMERLAKKGERAQIQEGKCHKCERWIALQSTKEVDLKIPELFWWKHAVACHYGSVLEGETDVFEDDEVYRKLKDIGH